MFFLSDTQVTESSIQKVCIHCLPELMELWKAFGSFNGKVSGELQRYPSNVLCCSRGVTVPSFPVSVVLCVILQSIGKHLL
jgi:hypothetical protein